MVRHGGGTEGPIAPGPLPEAVLTPRWRRLRGFWNEHRRLFWSLHSVWALGTGVVVISLARERYALLPWIGVFLVLTWASTLFFGRRLAEPSASVDLGAEATSYLTRIMYQETLFFLLPFYMYSTVPRSVNVGFVSVLGALAVLSCLDLVFDRWLRRSPVFRLFFFALVSFSAVELILPMLVPITPATATRIAAAVSVAGSIPLVLTGTAMGRWQRGRLLAVAIGLVVLEIAFPRLIPPVPLRVERVVFAPSIDRVSLAVADPLSGSVAVDDVPDGLYVLVEVFAPGSVPTEVRLDWSRDGQPLKTSREVRILAHESGFRVWDAWRPPDAPVLPGRYEVDVVTGDSRLFGRASIRVLAR
jgi:hypothetical protein